MKRVQFLRDTSRPVLDEEIPQGTLVLFRDGFSYGIPQISGAEYLEFLDYKPRYTTFNPPLIIVVGLNRIVTPSNRCEMVFEYLQTMTPNIPKMSIDTTPFIGEPWRLWFHYSIAGCGSFGITYSYALETEWEHWFYRDVPDCRLSGENVGLSISDTVSDLEPLHTAFEFEDITVQDEEWYAELKREVFERRDTPKLIINDLLRAANSHYGLNISFDSYRQSAPFSVPDLGIYRFVAEENLRRMATYNRVIQYENLSDKKRS